MTGCALSEYGADGSGSLNDGIAGKFVEVATEGGQVVAQAVRLRTSGSSSSAQIALAFSGFIFRFQGLIG